MPHTSYSEREREMMRRARPAHRLVKNKEIPGWKALWWITAPEQEAREVAAELGLDYGLAEDE